MMNSSLILEKLETALLDLDDAAADELTGQLLTMGVKPVDILTTCEQAMAAIGEKYAAGEYFISGLIMAGDMMSRVTELVTPHLAEPDVRPVRGRVLVGTVEGDIHDLGKNIAGALLRAHGFEVLDLGVDVGAAEFVRECLAFKPDIVGLSAMLSTCYHSMGDIVAAIKEFRSLRPRPLVFISGAQITAGHCRVYGADYQVDTAFDTVRLCEKVLEDPAVS